MRSVTRGAEAGVELEERTARGQGDAEDQRDDREEHGRWGSLDGGGSELTFGGAYSFRSPLLSADGVVMMVARAKMP